MHFRAPRRQRVQFYSPRNHGLTSVHMLCSESRINLQAGVEIAEALLS